SQNLNAADDHPDPTTRVASIMAEAGLQSTAYANHTSSTSSLEMIGWRDGDDDGVFDVLDVPLSLTGSGAYDGASRTHSFLGSSSVHTLNNLNPQGYGHAITLNEVDRLQYRTDGGDWIDAASYGTFAPSIDVQLGPLPADAQNIEIRTISNDSGATSDVFAGALPHIPNLVPEQPSGWSDAIVVSRGMGTNDDDMPLTPADTLYVDWAVLNNGNAAADPPFHAELYVDDNLQHTWERTTALELGSYWRIEDHRLGSLGLGPHTVRLVVDTDDAVGESDENDNAYARSFVVGVGEVRGTQWHDVNGDGMIDSGEPGLADRHVYLDVDESGERDIGEPDAWTDADGSYAITAIPPRSYVVAAVQQPGWEQTFPPASASGTGELTYVEHLSDGQGGVDGLNGATSVALSPDGRHVYTAALTDDAISMFRRDLTSGRLTFVQVLKDGQGGVDGLNGAFCVTVSPDGNHVYVAGRDDDAIAVFARDSASGELIFLQVLKDGQGGVDGLDSVRSVTVSPGGEHVYATGRNDDAVVLFARDTTSGELSFVEVLKDGQGGIDGLDGAQSVTVSPDGSYVYVAGGVDDAMAVFRRDPVDGTLTFVQVLKDGQGGVDGLDGARSLALSPDGRYLYVGATAVANDSVAVFSRELVSGELTFGEVLRDSQNGVDGLASVRSVTISPDGRHLYAAGRNDDSVALFRRDAVTGGLKFAQVLKDGQSGVDGMNAAQWVTVSPDGNHVYTTAGIDNAVAVFDREHAEPLIHRVNVAPGQTIENIDFGHRRAGVAGRYVSYNNSSWDDPLMELDDDAIAPDKTPLRPGETATTANYTNYDKGINCIVVDIAELPNPTALNATDDFVLKVGNSNDPSNWPSAPVPLSTTVREGAGIDGTDRITIIWPDNAIQSQWLQVTVQATENTGLLEPDVFYFGNAPGEAGDQAVNAIVNATDEIVARNFQHSAFDPAPIDDPYD
ncbi:MAG TPA: beta-propeller fold lactonase family protein, partial [Thermoguttaceae bacterium]|nr:beta-propeller fold lactonase family protein [Thermoguttaceae bacterium]